MSDTRARPRDSIGFSPGLRRLGWMLGLPLVDGVFLMIAMTGVLDSLVGVVVVGTMVFGGSGAIAVVLTELTDGNARRHLPGLVGIGGIVVALAGIQAAIAPTLVAIVDIEVLRVVAVVVLLLVAAQIGNGWLGARSPRIGVIVAGGVLLSLRPGAGLPPIVIDPTLGGLGALAALLGVIVSVGALVLGCGLRRCIDRDRFRYGGAIALGVLAATLVFPIPSAASLIVLLLALGFAVNGDAVRGRFDRVRPERESYADGTVPES